MTSKPFVRIEPRRRAGALVLIRTRHDEVLLVKPTYRPDWLLPGGGAHPGEPIGYAATREVAEELGLRRRITHALAIDQVPANPDTRQSEGLNIVCDGGLMTDAEAHALSVPLRATDEIEELAWVPPNKLSDYVAPFMEYRIRAALAAAANGFRLPLLYNGEPADCAAG
ncbi:NUDIX domain-containing protein [Kitasatospora sp. NPDC058032]|uniref:NUDIX domain-containing protein n=1 Tax=Kitasatospora sp. NPDC058032 TaxID=3346307 RepID=UPI0036D7B938